MRSSNDPDPIISIIIPTLNEERYLERTLKSLYAQKFSKPFEIIVSDGKSTDGTLEIANKLAHQVVVNGGQSTAAGRNSGAAIAKAPYLVFIDADTYVPPNFLSYIFPIFERKTCIAFCGGFRFDIDNPLAWLLEQCLHAYFVFLDIQNHTLVSGYNFCVHKDAFDQVGGFPDVFMEDLYLSRKLTAIGRVRYFNQFGVIISARRLITMGFWGALQYYLNIERLIRRKENFTGRYRFNQEESHKNLPLLRKP